VVAIDGVSNPTWEDILMKEFASAEHPLRVTLMRDGKEFDVTLTPELDERNGVGTAGWAEQAEIQIGGVVEGMDAQKKGLQRGDILVSVDGHPIRSSYKLRELVKASQGKPVEVVFLRDGKEQKVTVTPRLSEPEPGKQAWMIGVELVPRVTYTKLGFVDALRESIRHNTRSATLIYQFLRGIVMQRMSPTSLEGPIRIAQLSGDAAREGATAVFDLMAMVSLNLAILICCRFPF